jgi:deazaflavin-dependent oxidoreductase (nitroreductase family)
MARAALIALGTMAAAVSIAALVYVFGVRYRSPSVRNAARRFHHSVGNPLQMRRAGRPDAFASVVRHRGRKTGKTYETPVWAVPTEDGFVIAIVYGSRTDWFKNVLASGEATVVHRGVAYRVTRPEIVPRVSVRTYFPATLQRIHRRIGVDRCLRVRLVKISEDIRDERTHV